SFPSWIHLSRLRTERLPPLYSCNYAYRNCRTVFGGALRVPLSGPDISAPDHLGGSVATQSLHPARTDAARSDHRQHSAHSHLDASERSGPGSGRDGAVDRRVPRRPVRVRRSLPTARAGRGASISKISKEEFMIKIAIIIGSTRPGRNG